MRTPTPITLFRFLLAIALTLYSCGEGGGRISSEFADTSAISVEAGGEGEGEGEGEGARESQSDSQREWQ